MTLPKVSIVTITYNHENYILDALNSFLEQKYKGPIEVIVANDNSSDNTHKVVSNFLGTTNIPSNFEIKYTNHPINKGMVANFIWALQQATGEYIALCEGDDYWIDPLKLQKQVQLLENNTEYNLVFSNCKQIFVEKTTTIKTKIGVHIPVETREYSRLEIFENWIIPTASVIFRAYAIKNFDIFFINKGFIYGDTVLFLYVTKNSKLYGMSDIMSVYTRHDDGVTSKFINETDFINHLNQIIRSFGANFNSNKIKSLKSLYYFKKFDRQKKTKPFSAFYSMCLSLFLDKNYIKQYLQKIK